MAFLLLNLARGQEMDPCPSGTVTLKDSCLYHSKTKNTASVGNAKAACKADYPATAHRAAGIPFLPMNDEENAAFAKLHNKGHAYLPLLRNGKKFKSFDNRQKGKNAKYTKWSTGEPNNSGGKENFVEIIGSKGVWNDIGSTHKRSFACAVKRTLNIEHPHVMADVDVVKNLIDAVAASHSDMDASVDKVHSHVKQFKSVKNKAIGDLQKIRDQLSVMKGTLSDKKAKLSAEDAKITDALAKLKKKWMKLNEQQTKKLEDAEKNRDAQNKEISQMISHLSRRRRRREN